MQQIPLIDVFAGPGGLNEGFSAFKDTSGHAVFSTAGSFEMDPIACSTLRLRAGLRDWARGEGRGEFPSEYYDYLRADGHHRDNLQASPLFAESLAKGAREVHEFELSESSRSASNAKIRMALRDAGVGDGDKWVLVGGPPCQAYSLAGRSRRTNDVTFESDHKHTLYREYLNIIAEFSPSVFVMENVKGMLSSKLAGARIFDRIMDDLRSPGGEATYDVRSFVVATVDPDPADFIIRAEHYGVPQKRHRVILLGIRSDLGLGEPKLLRKQELVSVRDVLSGMPPIRSLVSPRSRDSVETWVAQRNSAAKLLRGRVKLGGSVPSAGSSFVAGAYSAESPKSAILRWLEDPHIEGFVQHESRAHMASDLQRYAYCSGLATIGQTVKVTDFPAGLTPKHRNMKLDTVPFSDRFRVQSWDAPSTTVVSHIAKDGHYYIHPDPAQMRSLSVREAARLQTFPDNYLFLGNRTQQYHQVGNAVPPYLAIQLAEVVAGLFDRA